MYLNTNGFLKKNSILSLNKNNDIKDNFYSFIFSRLDACFGVVEEKHRIEKLYSCWTCIPGTSTSLVRFRKSALVCYVFLYNLKRLSQLLRIQEVQLQKVTGSKEMIELPS